MFNHAHDHSTSHVNRPILPVYPYSPHRSPPDLVDLRSSSDSSTSSRDQTPDPIPRRNQLIRSTSDQSNPNQDLSNRTFEMEDSSRHQLGYEFQDHDLSSTSQDERCRSTMTVEDEDLSQETSRQVEEVTDETIGDDSLIDRSDDEVARRAAQILSLDQHGRLLPLSPRQDHLLDTVWNPKRSSTSSAPPQPTNASSSGLPSSSHTQLYRRREPVWLNRLRETVLFDRNRLDVKDESDESKQEEQRLVLDIQQNLRFLVNELNQDQWLYPSPPAFSASNATFTTTSQPTIGGPQRPSHEAYLESDFNPQSLNDRTSHLSTHTIDEDLRPRQLWLGEDEDQGLESEISLIDLLRTNPSSTPTPHRNGHDQVHHSHHRWLPPGPPPPSRSSVRRHGQGSALARQVSRLGMSE